MSALRQKREELGMTQAELAKLVGTSQPQIKRLEAADRKLTKEWAVRLAPHLRTTAEELLFPTSDESSPNLDRLTKRLELLPMDDLEDTLDFFEKYLDTKRHISKNPDHKK